MSTSDTTIGSVKWSPGYDPRSGVTVEGAAISQLDCMRLIAATRAKEDAAIWNAALDAIRAAIPKLPTYDENGYITKWSDLMTALEGLKR